MDQHARSGRATSASGSPPAPGRRELNKADKVRRIRAAARHVFLSKGYDEATTREIASRAKVALGTLFLYANGKRDLLFLVVNDDYIDMADHSAAAVRDDAPLLDNLVAIFRPLYQYFAAEPKLSRLALREMLFYEAGMQALRFAGARGRMIEITAGAVRIALRSGQIGTTTPPDLIGRIMFSVYQVEVRRWLAGETLDVADGLKELRQIFKVVIEGLSPTRSAVTKSKRSKDR